MKRRIWLDISVSSEPNFDREWLGKYRLFILDTNILKAIAYGGEDDEEEAAKTLARIMGEWGRSDRGAVCCIPDFIRIECFNMERHKLGDSRIRHFLKDVEESEEGLYIELKTPIKGFSADDRRRLLNLFPKRYRHPLIKRYTELSGTDVSLLFIALLMASYGLSVTIASFDNLLTDAAEDFGIGTYPPLQS